MAARWRCADSFAYCGVLQDIAVLQCALMSQLELERYIASVTIAHDFFATISAQPITAASLSVPTVPFAEVLCSATLNHTI